MLLQLQFIANGIIGLLSQSITSLLKLISMIIHWNHHENTLSWWIFPPSALQKDGLTLKRKFVMPNILFASPVCSGGEQCLVISLQFWKTQCPFLETANWFNFYSQSQELEMQITVAVQALRFRAKYWACVDLIPNISSSIHSTNIYSVSSVWL